MFCSTVGGRGGSGVTVVVSMRIVEACGHACGACGRGGDAGREGGSSYSMSLSEDMLLPESAAPSSMYLPVLCVRTRLA